MDINELNRAISELEGRMERLLNEQKPLENKVSEIQKEASETDREYQQKIELLARERQEKAKAFQEKKNEIQQEVWKIQSESSKLTVAMKQLQEQHAQALAEIAAKERLESLYNSVRDFFEDSPWSAYVKDYQKEDILAALRIYQDGKRGVLNANVMGSGKTFEAGALIDILIKLFYDEFDRKPLILWLTRKALVKSTAKELMEWNPERKFAPVEGTKDMRENLLEIVVQANLPAISNYELLNSTEKARNIPWDIIVMDECHKLKGGTDVKVFHHTKEVTDKARFFLGLSGSPIQNKPEDIWPVFNILDEQRFPSVRRFQREFLRERWDENKKKHVQGVDEERLINVMQGQVIKQDPKIIQSAWPDKRRIFKVVEMDGAQREVYDKCKLGVISHFAKEAESDPDKKISITAIIAQLTYLRQINVWPGGVTVQSPDGQEAWNVNCHESAKLDEAEALVEEITGEGEQVVVWSSQFNEPIFELERRLNSNFPELTVATMTGRTPDVDRKGNEEKFQNGEIDVLICNRSAFSEGFNFQKNPSRWAGGASKAIFLDAWWNPKANEQAEDRIWRVGQSDNVDIYYIYTDDSVDAFIAAKLDEKEAMIKGIMDSDALRPSEVVGLLEDLL